MLAIHVIREQLLEQVHPVLLKQLIVRSAKMERLVEMKLVILEPKLSWGAHPVKKMRDILATIQELGLMLLLIDKHKSARNVEMASFMGLRLVMEEPSTLE